MKKIPVLIMHDELRVIGWMEINEAQLPETPNYHFAIGGHILESNERGEITKFDLKEVSLVFEEVKKYE